MLSFIEKKSRKNTCFQGDKPESTHLIKEIVNNCNQQLQKPETLKQNTSWGVHLHFITVPHISDWLSIMVHYSSCTASSVLRGQGNPDGFFGMAREQTPERSGRSPLHAAQGVLPFL